MCGIALAISRSGRLDINLLQRLASRFISTRGPDSYGEFSTGHEFACQSVLRIQSGKTMPESWGLGSSKYLLYNGEIFESPNLNRYQSDTELLSSFRSSRDIWKELCNADGLYSIVVVEDAPGSANERCVTIFRDPTGEKHIYYYVDEDLFIVSSVPGFIAHYLKRKGKLIINDEALEDYIVRRHLITVSSTAIYGLNQISQGSYSTFQTGSWSLKLEIARDLLDELLEEREQVRLSRMTDNEFSVELRETMSESLCVMESVNHQVGETIAAVISGGIDSSLGAALIPRGNKRLLTYCLQFPGKDPVAEAAGSLSRTIQADEHFDVCADVKLYMNELQRCIDLLASPIHTHSLASTRILASEVAKNSHKILYSGEGADELFLGYSTYADIYKSNEKRLSDYSQNVNRVSGIRPEEHTQNSLKNLYNDSFDKFIQAGFTCASSIVKAAAYVDLKHQVPTVGTNALDTVVSDTGMEGRSVYLRRRVLSLGLNCPVENKLIGCAVTGRKRQFPIMKMALARLYETIYKVRPSPKIGFSGYPNETAFELGAEEDWMIYSRFPTLKNIKHNRAMKWKIINIEWFLRAFASDI